MRNRVDALGLLQPLSDIGAANDEAILARVASCCADNGAESVEDITSTHSVEEFLRALELKSIKAKKLRGLLEPSTTVLDSFRDASPERGGMTMLAKPTAVAADDQSMTPPPQLQAAKLTYDVFISHASKDDSLDVYRAVNAFLAAKDKHIFNPATDLSHAERVNKRAMQDAVRRSRLVVAALSAEFFASEWCEAEIAAAKEAGIKVVPVYSGDDDGAKQCDRWVETYKDHVAFGWVFKEQARDGLNKMNMKQVRSTLNYLATLC